MSYRDDDGYKMPVNSKKYAGSGNADGSRPAGKSPGGSRANGYKMPAGSKSSVRTAAPAKAAAKKPANRQRRTIKALVAVFCVLVAGVIAIGIYFIARWKNDDYSSLQSSGLVVLAPGSTSTPEPAPSDVIPAADSLIQASAGSETVIVCNGQKYIRNRNIVNLLFLGIDTNADRKKSMRGYRSDMVMVCAVDTAEKKATLISIPRDTYTTMYKVDDKTGQIEQTVQDKINAAYAYGGGATHYSYPNAMACVEMFLERRCELCQPLDFELDIPVYLYAGVDMDGIPQVASAVGGIDVTLKESVPGVGKKGQSVTLKHKNAFEFLSNRHDTAGGDEGRAARQQQFMIALAKKIKSMGPVDMILSLYDELQKYVWTNLNTDQMIDFAKILTKVNIDSIDMHLISGEGKKVDGTYYMYHDEAATLQLLLDVYYTRVS